MRLLLLVEDNPADVDLLLEGLRVDDASTDIQIEALSTGVEALRRLRDHRKPAPDLIMLDLNLPARGGHEVLAEIRQDPDLHLLPVIIFTSSAAPEEVRTSYALGANCHVTKPEGLARYLDVARTVEEFWLRTAALPPADAPPSPATRGGNGHG